MGQQKKRRTFKKFSYRGNDLDDLLKMSTEEFTNMTNSRHRRSLRRGLKKKHQNLIAKLNKEKIAVHGTMERPKPVKTHLRDIMILPQMVGNIIGIYNGKRWVLRSRPKWSELSPASTVSPTSQCDTVDRVSAPLTAPDLSHSSKSRVTLFESITSIIFE